MIYYRMEDRFGEGHILEKQLSVKSLHKFYFLKWLSAALQSLECSKAFQFPQQHLQKALYAFIVVFSIGSLSYELLSLEMVGI